MAPGPDDVDDAPPARNPHEIDESTCLDLLGSTTIGRIAFLSSRGVELLPVNFRAHERALYVRTSGTSVLSELAAGRGDVVFEVDHHGGGVARGWSVVVRGPVAAVTEPERSQLAAVLRLHSWAPGTRDLWLRMAVTTITGRRVRRHPEHPGASPGT